MIYLSFLMAWENIQDEDLKALNIEVVEKAPDGDRKLKIPSRYLSEYLNLIEDKLTPGFWNEVVGEKEIFFIFKFKDESVYRYELTTENEKKISELCSRIWKHTS